MEHHIYYISMAEEWCKFLKPFFFALVPQLGIEPMPCAVEGQDLKPLNHQRNPHILYFQKKENNQVLILSSTWIYQKANLYHCVTKTADKNYNTIFNLNKSMDLGFEHPH